MMKKALIISVFVHALLFLWPMSPSSGDSDTLDHLQVSLVIRNEYQPAQEVPSSDHDSHSDTANELATTSHQSDLTSDASALEALASAQEASPVNNEVAKAAAQKETHRPQGKPSLMTAPSLVDAAAFQGRILNKVAQLARLSQVDFRVLLTRQLEVQVEVLATGKVGSVKVLKSSGLSSLDARVVQAIYESDWQPQTMNQVAQTATAILPIQFLEGA